METHCNQPLCFTGYQVKGTEKGGSQMEDQEIVELYWKRDESALEHSREKYHGYLSRIAQQILYDREDSEEVVNDTYFKAWQSMPPQRPSKLSIYLGRLTRHGAIDYLRRRTSQKRGGATYEMCVEELEESVPGGETPQQALEEKLLVQLLNQFLETLSPQARALFLGRYYYFDPLWEVARYCGMGEGQAKSQLFRIRKRLKAYLEQEGFVV